MHLAAALGVGPAPATHIMLLFVEDNVTQLGRKVMIARVAARARSLVEPVAAPVMSLMPAVPRVWTATHIVAATMKVTITPVRHVVLPPRTSDGTGPHPEAALMLASHSECTSEQHVIL